MCGSVVSRRHILSSSPLLHKTCYVQGFSLKCQGRRPGDRHDPHPPYQLTPATHSTDSDYSRYMCVCVFSKIRYSVFKPKCNIVDVYIYIETATLVNIFFTGDANASTN